MRSLPNPTYGRAATASAVVLSAFQDKLCLVSCVAFSHSSAEHYSASADVSYSHGTFRVIFKDELNKANAIVLQCEKCPLVQTSCASKEF